MDTNRKNKIVEELFAGIDIVHVDQGTEEWLSLRRSHLVSSDVTPIVLFHAFNNSDPFTKLNEILKNKLDGKSSQFLNSKFRLGRMFEDSVIKQMKSSQDKFISVFPSPVFQCKRFLVSADCLCEMPVDQGERRHFRIYEIKYTESMENVFNPIDQGDVSNIYVKKYSLQLAFHMVSIEHYLKRLYGDVLVDGVIICGIATEDGKVKYARYDIPSTDSLFCNAILHNKDHLIDAYDKIITGEEPYDDKKNKRALLQQVDGNSELIKMLNEFNELYDQHVLLGDRLELFEAALVDKMSEYNISEVDCDGRRFTLYESKRVKKMPVDSNKDAVAVLKDEIKHLQAKLDDLYFIETIKKKKITIREI